MYLLKNFRIGLIRLKMGRISSVIWIFPIFLLCSQRVIGGETYSTWEGFEADKCASIWLIMRFIDKEAKIKFFPRGSEISEGILFDVPEAKLRRTHNMSTFVSILRHYKIGDPKLDYIGNIIHDIEINIWEKKVFEDTSQVQNDVMAIIVNTKTNEEIISKSIEYFDSFYDKIILK